MRGEVWLLMGVAIVCGAAVASQGAINALLARRLEHPLQSALISFLVGTVALIVVSAAWGVSRPSMTTLSSTPWHLWMGGLIGAVFVTAMIILTPQLGSTLTIGCVIAGQVVASVVLDHFGLLGLPTIPISGRRLLGVGLLVVGVLLIRR